MNYEKIPAKEIINRTTNNLQERGIKVVFAADRKEALEKVKELIPKGAEVMNASSTTLDQIGFVDYLKAGQHGWNNLHLAILEEKDQAKQGELRKRSILSDYFLGSVHAITEKGQLVVASASGSQIPSYSFASNNVIWVASANKIVPTLEDAIRRIWEYCLPLEDQRIKSTGGSGSTIGKILIFEREILPSRQITLILVNEKLGF